ncbi:MAG: prolyl oligopeptidase family serine peptidase [Abditibacteriota bacterium]|nr:prolyl oligopeptidase family serine peptidase [Abditibacteriota bacterium]
MKTALTGLCAAIAVLAFLAVLLLPAGCGAAAFPSDKNTGKKPLAKGKTMTNTLADAAIDLDNISSFAFTNVSIVKKPVKGVVISFHGLGYNGMIGEQNDYSRSMAEKGIVYIFPYYGPWSWMNRSGVRFTDAVVEAVFKGFSLPKNTPIVSTGGSMGGLSALVYPVYARRTPVAVAADSPVCDLVYHFGERPDLPRTLVAAFADYDCSLDEALRSASPIDLVKKMPKIRYYIVHGDKDAAVNKKAHPDRLVPEMKRAGLDVTYVEVPGMEHCNMGDAAEGYYSFIEANILK